VAFAAIVFAGVCGALIGWALVDLQYSGTSDLPEALGLFIGGVAFALGVAVIAVLSLRAMAEWRAQLELDE
jgi:hypothetical protein